MYSILICYSAIRLPSRKGGINSESVTTVHTTSRHSSSNTQSLMLLPSIYKNANLTSPTSVRDRPLIENRRWSDNVPHWCWLFNALTPTRYAVAKWYGAGLCDRNVVGSTPARGCCVPTPTQCAIPPGSVNEYQRKLGSKRAYHAMHWPRIRGLATSAGVQLRATGNGDQRCPIGPWGSGRTLLYYYYYAHCCHMSTAIKHPVPDRG